MAQFGITASATGLTAADPGQDPLAGLRRRVARLAPDAPVVVLVHGYQFDPALPSHDPHRSLFAAEPEGQDWRVRSWPRGLGFAADAGETGLCVGFGWPALAPLWRSLRDTRRTSFAQVYDRAADYGPRLAELVTLLQGLVPDRPIDIVAHSLGARVALAALPHLDRPPGRVVLLGAAEFDTAVLDFLCAAPALPQIYNVTARANDLYDAMFETFAPRRTWRDRAVGLGLRAPFAAWIDLQIDRADVTAWVNGRGIALRPAHTRFCHWSFYTRDGAFAVYQAILNRRPGWDIADLREAPCFAAQEPRWSRLPRGRRALRWALRLATPILPGAERA